MRKKQWIVITGLDGSGKTTLLDKLEEWLVKDKQKKVYRDRLPHDQYLVKNILNVSKDSYTDRMLFALDNRIFGTKLREIMEQDQYDYDIILTQRGFLDSFVHGAVQGYSYEWIEELNRITDLPSCDIMIHMVADALVAYNRIRDDDEADKFEYPEYMSIQERETRKAYLSVIKGNEPALAPFRKCNQNIFVDTTKMIPEEVFEKVKKEIRL